MLTESRNPTFCMGVHVGVDVRFVIGLDVRVLARSEIAIYELEDWESFKSRPWRNWKIREVQLSVEGEAEHLTRCIIWTELQKVFINPFLLTTCNKIKSIIAERLGAVTNT